MNLTKTRKALGTLVDVYTGRIVDPPKDIPPGNQEMFRKHYHALALGALVAWETVESLHFTGGANVDMLTDERAKDWSNAMEKFRKATRDSKLFF